MADYYPLLAKAVAGLQNAQDRRGLYERGRAALIAELEAIRPPLGRAIIYKERLAFEEAIRKVETEIVPLAQGPG
ncbi:MAG: hypothetical protein WB822_17185 [Rhodoplanes sp.]